MHAIDPLYSVCGFVGGLLVGMTGVGGGALMTCSGSIRRPRWARGDEKLARTNPVGVLPLGLRRGLSRARCCMVTVW